MVTDAIWRKGPGLILRPNPGCTSVIHGRIWSQNDSRSLIPENRVFGWNFYLMKMINSMSLLTCPPDSFPGMTELHAGNDSYLYQDSPLLLHLWPIFFETTPSALGQIQNAGFAILFWHSSHLMSNYPNSIRCLENKSSRESCRGDIPMQISTSDKSWVFRKETNSIWLHTSTLFFLYCRNTSIAN